MRLWDYRLLKVLPDRFIVAEWRECIAIKRQWEKGTLKHRLVSYVMNYSKTFFLGYVLNIIEEMQKRNIKFNRKYYKEISDFCEGFTTANYPEHDERYLRQCLYNLQEKADRGIITREEWDRIIYDISFEEYQNGQII